MNAEPVSPIVSIEPFTWERGWHALWVLRHHQLTEEGIIGPLDIPDQPEDVERDGYEWDYHHMAEIYLSGAGGFWLAWCGDDPAGHIGGQDLGGVLELRHMYVRAVYRRRGIATALVQALLDHCKTQSVKAVELWTGWDGEGRGLYERMGFRVTAGPGEEFYDLDYRLNRTPGEGEIRMRFDVA